MDLNTIGAMMAGGAGSAMTGSVGPGTAASGADGSQMPFSNLLRSALESEQQLESDATSTVQGLMAGNGVDVHEAMIATQKANLAFEMTLAVRNKAVAAYQQLMQMQF
ncbi:flagellar hook-basal body complex protein FliE [Silvibacterium dinghuense]|nr:flagellar hook-basal body complex protein FliE [Silvibacterium dinghuense]